MGVNLNAQPYTDSVANLAWFVVRHFTFLVLWKISEKGQQKRYKQADNLSTSHNICRKMKIQLNRWLNQMSAKTELLQKIAIELSRLTGSTTYVS